MFKQGREFRSRYLVNKAKNELLMFLLKCVQVLHCEQFHPGDLAFSFYKTINEHRTQPLASLSC